MADVTRAEGQDQVPGTGEPDQALDHPRPVAAHVGHVPVAVGPDALGEIGPAHPEDRGLAGG
ncbi:MAG: hypothetical protein ACREK6_13865, partial [Candidatus Rokuibacteriota bacterium]